MALGCSADGPATQSANSPAQARQQSQRSPTPVPCLWDARIDNTKWASGLDSMFAPVPPPADFKCLKDTGCGVAQHRIPPCPGGPDDPARVACRPTEAARVSDQISGRVVALAGKLGMNHSEPVPLGMCADDCCEKGCCAASHRRIFLEGVQFIDTRRPLAFTCQGDDSRWCCGFQVDPGAEVVAVGTWVPANGAHVAQAALVNPRFCKRERAGQ